MCDSHVYLLTYLLTFDTVKKRRIGNSLPALEAGAGPVSARCDSAQCSRSAYSATPPCVLLYR